MEVSNKSGPCLRVPTVRIIVLVSELMLGGAQFMEPPQGLCKRSRRANVQGFSQNDIQGQGLLYESLPIHPSEAIDTRYSITHSGLDMHVSKTKDQPWHERTSASRTLNGRTNPTVEARKLEHDHPANRNQRKKEHQRKSPCLHP